MEDILDTFAGGSVAIILAIGIVAIGVLFVDKVTRRVGNDYVQYRYANCIGYANDKGMESSDCSLIRGALIEVK